MAEGRTVIEQAACFAESSGIEVFLASDSFMSDVTAAGPALPDSKLADLKLADLKPAAAEMADLEVLRCRSDAEDHAGTFLRIGTDEFSFEMAALPPQGATGQGYVLYGVDAASLGKAEFSLMLRQPCQMFSHQGHDVPMCASATQVARLRVLAAGALRLSQLPGCIALCWPPSGAIMGAGYFKEVIGQWLNGGAFPALGLISIRADADGAMHSRGLTALAGQEVAALPGSAPSRAERAKLIMRIADHIVRTGPLDRPGNIEVAGIGTVALTLSANRSKVFLDVQAV
ncbi:hypothetical protein RM533_04590 [Croceicoccus sp. F390]|uniref:Uncharacterized protein n=1 Tax=Croceicoccus esteveae TaxID=3075597 RepID=A0ABU2ZFT0_9SPHN|nr:hypothetical protein [Croceicoccus sp. F390]MDT0575457.1 hypothetical protein [Croceicoccus sp. F390]